MNSNNTNGTKKFKLSDKTLTTLLYVGAAILVVTILVISIVSIASRNKKSETPTPGTSSETAVTSTEAPTTTEAPSTTANNLTNVDKPTAATPVYVLPVEGVVSKGHDSETLVYSVTMNDYRAHLGVDIEASVASPVYAVCDGTVKSVYTDYLMGQCIEIEHSDGIVSCYKNLAETLPDGIVEGVSVTSGQLIGSVGETAIIEQCEESHLHFEMTKNGEYLDPLDYLSFGKNTETIEK